MLTDADIELIKRTRAEITQNRTDSVIIYQRQLTGEDPFTGDKTYEDIPTTVEATWTRLTSQSAGGAGDAIEYVNGVRVEPGNVIANFDIEDVDFEGVRDVMHVKSGERYTVKAYDTVGLGEDNRHYVLLERVT